MKTSSQDIVHLSFCRIVFVMFFFLRQERVSHPTFFNNLSIETSLVAPLTIRAASCIFSSSFASYCVQLSHTTSAYSSNGLINEKKMICSDFLLSWNLSFRITCIRCQAFSFISRVMPY